MEHYNLKRKLDFVTIGQPIESTEYYARLGNAISISDDGTRLAVASRSKDMNYYEGLVHLYDYNETTDEWIMVGPSISLDGVVESIDVDLKLSGDGSRFIVGTVVNDDGPNSFSCEARVYTHFDGQFITLGDKFQGEESIGDNNDVSVSINYDGTRVAVAFSLDNGGKSDNGVTRVYDLVNMQWVQVGNSIEGENAFDLSGYVVALSSDGTTLAVSSPYHSTANGGTAGSVHIYRFISNVWTLLGTEIIGENDGDASGSNLAISSNGNRIAISSEKFDSNDDDAEKVDVGHVRIFDYDPCSNQWNQMGEDIVGERGEVPLQDYGYHVGDHFGKGLALSNDGLTVAIGAPYNHGDGNYYTGSVQIFKYDASNNKWSPVGNDVIGAGDQDYAGWSVAMNGNANIIAIGSPGSNENAYSNGSVIVRKDTPPFLIQIAPTETLIDGCSPLVDIIGLKITNPGKNTRLSHGILASSVIAGLVLISGFICYLQRSKVSLLLRRRWRSN
jgi:hypothetical protein